MKKQIYSTPTIKVKKIVLESMMAASQLQDTNNAKEADGPIEVEAKKGIWDDSAE